MTGSILVLGAGLQGSACAYDLAVREEREVGRTKLDDRVAHHHPVGRLVDHQAPDVADLGDQPARPPEQRAHAREQLVDHVGLDHVVVGTGLERGQPSGHAAVVGHEHQERVAVRP